MYFFQATLFESSAKKGRVRSRMGSGQRMGSVQQVAIKFYRHIFLLVYVYFTLPFETSGTASCGTTGITFSLIVWLLPDGPFLGDATLSKRRLLDYGVLLKVQTALRFSRRSRK